MGGGTLGALLRPAPAVAACRLHVTAGATAAGGR